jgi:TetR/AcrR family transcriptional regulator, cholesterol catabolism regulator
MGNMAQEQPDIQPTRPAKREDEILEAALDLFFERGFRAVGLRDLTEVLNLNVATLYHYFKSKDKILFRLQEDGMVRLLGGAEQVTKDTAGLPVSAKLEALLRMHLQYHTDHYKTAKLHFSDFHSLGPESQATIRKLMKQYEQLFIDVVHEGMASGEFCGQDPKLMAFTLLGAGAYVSYWYRPDGRASAEEIVASNIEILMQGVLTR